MKIRVHSKRNTFYRAGMKFGDTPVELDTDELEKGALAQLEAEPMLVVERLGESPKAGNQGGGKSAGQSGTKQAEK